MQDLANDTLRDEARMYWLISQAVRHRGGHAASLTEAAGEFATLAENSDWPTLRARCASNLSSIASVVSAEASVA